MHGKHGIKTEQDGNKMNKTGRKKTGTDETKRRPEQLTIFYSRGADDLNYNCL